MLAKWISKIIIGTAVVLLTTTGCSIVTQSSSDSSKPIPVEPSGPGTGGETPPEIPEYVLLARDAALDYIRDNYTEVLAPEGDMFSVDNTTPSGLLGSGSFRFSWISWTIDISYPIVALENTILDVVVMESDTDFVWQGQFDVDGNLLSGDAKPITSDTTGIEVIGWLGEVVSTESGVMLALSPNAGSIHLSGHTAELDAKISELTDHPEPGKYANFWGTLNWVEETQQWLLTVTRIRSGTEVTEREPVSGISGQLISNQPGAQFSTFFMLDGLFPVVYDLSSALDDAGDTYLKYVIDDLVDTGKSFTVDGEIFCGVPAPNGCIIQATKLIVNGEVITQ